MKRISLGPSLSKQLAAHERNMARWEKAGGQWPWRDYLTDDERETIAKADAAKSEWQRLNKERAAITNRAIQRAKYHSQQKPEGD